ncbi:MAG: methyltransferase domain-containing protein [Anaerolineales bacterium]|nr:methyltransferase domain-containing protein [Anaerolineales bacterium]
MSKTTVFDYQAQVGLTKHMGGLAATETLIRLCGIEAAHEVLEVGCGVGQTSVLLVKRCGCRVVGVDLRPGMLAFAEARARKHRVSDRTEFRVGDITDLPFGDKKFDVVFGESITVFAPDHAKAIHEYARVLKHGGVLGLNETVWLKTPPPEIEAWMSRELSGGAHTRTVGDWGALMEGADLSLDVSQVHAYDIRTELRGMLQRYGCGGYLVVVLRQIGLYIRDPDYRSFVREIQQDRVIPENLDEYLGYGLFVARKL